MTKSRVGRRDRKGQHRVPSQTAAVPTIFAALFLSSPPDLQVEPGYYDAELQVYVSSKTGRPAYVGLSSSERTKIADTTGSRCSITTMTGQRNSPDDHSDSVQDDFD